MPLGCCARDQPKTDFRLPFTLATQCRLLYGVLPEYPTRSKHLIGAFQASQVLRTEYHCTSCLAREKSEADGAVPRLPLMRGRRLEIGRGFRCRVPVGRAYTHANGFRASSSLHLEMKIDTCICSSYLRSVAIMEQRKVVIKRVRRKQHSSCDQCRKAKRACDAALRAEGSEDSITQHGSAVVTAPVGSCSNCQRSGKICTFEWLQHSLPKLHAGGIKQFHGRSKGTGNVAKRKAIRSVEQILPQWSPAQREPAFVSSPDQDWGHFDVDSLHAWETYNVARDDSGGMGKLSPSLSFFPEMKNPSHGGSTYSKGLPSLDLPARTVMKAADSLAERQTGASWYSFDPDCLTDLELDILQSTAESVPASYVRPSWPKCGETWPAISRETSDQDDSSNVFSPSLLFSDQVSSANSRLALSQNWLHVYHDSLENALSCWLTERNCPYSTNKYSRRAPTSSPFTADGIQGEWGPKWSNRIYARVCRLDQVSSSLPGKQLTRLEQEQSAKALNLAIMAFGVQWAQSGTRGRVHSPRSFQNDDFSLQDDLGMPSADSFGRTMQETLWNQARQALLNAAGVQSYKVVFANLIFSLTQRPLDINQWLQNRETGGSMGSVGSLGVWDDSLHSSWNALQEVLSADGPPIFLESALRELASSRWKWDAQSRKQLKSSLQRADTIANGSQASPGLALSQEHQETFKLLSWLAIMFDTLSATVLQRPLVISDEDTGVPASDPWKEGTNPSSTSVGDDETVAGIADVDLDGWDPNYGQPDTDREVASGDIWGSFFLNGKDLPDVQTLEQGTWSCTFEEGAAILCDAAPVKVLLFRKVGHIQKLMSRKAASVVLEAALEEAVKVYRFWNKSYGRFIEYCMKNHHDLPARIQSWYVVLAGHWHLGGLLLADVIDELDSAGLGGVEHQEKRRIATLSSDLRKKNAISISDLCRCSLGGPSLSFSKSREFAYPVNQVALLSEPWTAVLVQSFSRAGYVFLDQLSRLPTSRSNSRLSLADERKLMKSRCESCIDGLLNLGNKSDMAYLAAKLLTDALQTVRG